MKKPFREHHLLQLLAAYDQQSRPIDSFMSQYMKNHKSLGSKDKSWISDTACALIRWKGLLDAQENAPCWEGRLAKLNQLERLKENAIPLYQKVSFPKELFAILEQAFGEKQAVDFCLASNERAPTTIRANLLKTTRDSLLSNLIRNYSIEATASSPLGMRFLQKIHLFSLPEYRLGHFEVQDEASQMLALLIAPQPGQQVLDYCAGSGGKTLAFAPYMQQKGQIYLHDIRPYVLVEAKKRLKRAGIQNAQILLPQNEGKMRSLKKKMDWVLVDVPCSGSGTYRRNPDMKWKFHVEGLGALLRQQRTIFERALSFMKPDGKIIYTTCSVLPQENEEQVAYFQRTHGLKSTPNSFRSFPSLNGMDGMFGAILTRNS